MTAAVTATGGSVLWAVTATGDWTGDDPPRLSAALRQEWARRDG